MKKMSLWEFFALIDGYAEANTSEDDTSKKMTQAEYDEIAADILNYDYSVQG